MKYENKLFDELATQKKVAIKVSFEDEGLDFIDILNIKKFTLKHDIELLLKIAGAEAKRDFKDANKIGVEKIVAPMIESSFALSKYIKTALSFVDPKIIRLGFNMESKQCFDNIEIILSAKESDFLTSITVGRGDLAESYNLDRYEGSVNSSKIYDITKKTFLLGKSKGLKTYLGGSMNHQSEEFVLKLKSENLIDFFETRNMVFDISVLDNHSFDQIIDLAFDFEKNKMEARRSYYELLYNEDFERLKRLSNL
jgi:4-hydroxy-2-oxoheptanedioate aldolase